MMLLNVTIDIIQMHVCIYENKRNSLETSGGKMKNPEIRLFLKRHAKALV